MRQHLSDAILLRQLFKKRQGALDRLRRDAVGGAEMPRAAEVAAGDKQKIILLGTLAEGMVVRLQRLRKKVERALRLDAGEASVRRRAATKMAHSHA